MNRYIKITIFTLVCFCFNINKMYACDEDPIPVMTSTPDEFKIFMYATDSKILSSNSYDPDNGVPYGSNNGIVQWKWDIFDYDEKPKGSGDGYYVGQGVDVNSSCTFSPTALGLGAGHYAVDLIVKDNEDIWVNGYDYYGDSNDWCGTRDFYIPGIKYFQDISGRDEHYLPTGVGETFYYSLLPRIGADWEPDILTLYIKDASENYVYTRSFFGVNSDVLLEGSIIWDGLGSLDPYNGLPLPPGNYTVNICARKSGIFAYETNPLTIFDVSIISPSASCDDSPIPTSSWLSDPNYRYDFQGIASGATGFYDIYIKGIIPLVPPLSYKWTLTNVGSLNNNTTPTPTISNPTTGEGTLTLIAMNGTTDTGAHDTRKLKIYPDHLARDVDNFKDGKACDPNIELPDGSLVTGKLSCASAATHALDGTDGSGTYLRNYSWSNNPVPAEIPYSTFAGMTLQRGWVLELRYDFDGDGDTGFLHWQTVLEEDEGATAITYAADASSKEFRYEKVIDYYTYKGYTNSNNQRIIIYQP